MDIKYIMAIVGISGLVLAIVTAIKNGIFTRYKLNLIVGLFDNTNDVPKKAKGKTKRTLIFGTKPMTTNQSILYCSYGLENPTNLPIKDVLVEFQYPSKYLLNDSIFIDEDAKQAILVKASNDSERIVIRLLDVAIVRYEIPLIRAHETMIFPDMMYMNKMSAKDFNAENSYEKNIARIYERFSDVKKFFGACIIRVVISSSNFPRPISKDVVLLSFSTTSKDELVEIFNESINKVWDDKYPKPGRYFQPFPFRLIFSNKLFKVELGEVIIQPKEELPTSEEAIARSIHGTECGVIQFTLPPWGIQGESFDVQHYMGMLIKEYSQPPN